MRYAYIQGGKVINVISEFDRIFPGVPITERYSPDFLKSCIKVEDNTEIGQEWDYDAETGQFSKPVPEPEPEGTESPENVENAGGRGGEYYLKEISVDPGMAFELLSTALKHGEAVIRI